MCNPPDEGWMSPKAAQGQHELVARELTQNPFDVAPYGAFLEAMNYIFTWETRRDSWTLLDIGCGVGAYSVLVDNHYGFVKYRGCDISPEMIRFARQDFGDRFFVCDALTVAGEADILLASSLIEPLPNWRQVLRHLLGLPFRWLILNRVRSWNDPKHPTTERVYTTIYGTPTFEVVHHQAEIAQILTAVGMSLEHEIDYQIEHETTLKCLLVRRA